MVLLTAARAGAIASVNQHSQWYSENGKLWILHTKPCITFRIKSKLPNMTFKVSCDMVSVFLCSFIFLHILFLLYTSPTMVHWSTWCFLGFLPPWPSCNLFLWLNIISHASDHWLHFQDSACLVLLLFLSLH